MDSMKVKYRATGEIVEVVKDTCDAEPYYYFVLEQALWNGCLIRKQDCEIVETERDKILTKNELELLRKDFWEFLEFDHGCLCGVHPAPCGWCTHPGNFIEDQLENLGYTTEQIQRFKDDEPIHKILSVNKPQNDWFPGIEIVQANIMQIMPDRTQQKLCGECIYYEAERCVKELTNEHGHCPKWRKSV